MNNTKKESLERRIEELERKNESLEITRLELQEQKEQIKKLKQTNKTLEITVLELKKQEEQVQEARKNIQNARDSIRLTKTPDDALDDATEQLIKHLDADEVSIYLRTEENYSLLKSSKTGVQHLDCEISESETMEFVYKKGKPLHIHFTEEKDKYQKGQLCWYLGIPAVEEDNEIGNTELVINVLKTQKKGKIKEIGDSNYLAERICQELVARLHRFELTKKVTTDELTGLAPRFQLERRLKELCNPIRRRKTENKIAYVLLDIDDFKDFNGRFSHTMGDEVLRRVGQGTRNNCRDEDFAARYGGDEIMLIFPEINTREAIFKIVQRIKKEVASIQIKTLIDEVYGNNNTEEASVKETEYLNRLVLTGIEKLGKDVDQFTIKTYQEWNTPRILIVDDEPSIRDLLKQQFKMDKRFKDCTIVTASSAENALEQHMNTRYAAIISDYDMGEMTGLELLSQIKEKNVLKTLLTGKNVNKNTIAKSEPIHGYYEKTNESIKELRNNVYTHITEKFVKIEVPETAESRREKLVKLELSLFNYLSEEDANKISQLDYSTETTIGLTAGVLLSCEINQALTPKQIESALSEAVLKAKQYKPKDYTGYVSEITIKGQIRIDAIPDDEMALRF